MIVRSMLVSAVICGAVAAENHPVEATVEWIGASSACEPGKPLQTAISMIHEPGWHSYWINPGEAGLKTSVKWKLPPGWTSTGIGFPAPARFITSNLAGFGYAGTVLFPVTVTPPADFSGTARLEAVVSWLACSEEGCMPGKAEIHLDLVSGAPEATPGSPEISAAYRNVPRPAGDSVRLAVTETEKDLVLSIEARSGESLDLDGREFFPATADVIDPRVPIRFVKKDGTWKTVVPKSAYAAGRVKQLTLVLAPNEGNDALEFTWTAP